MPMRRASIGFPLASIAMVTLKKCVKSPYCGSDVRRCTTMTSPNQSTRDTAPFVWRASELKTIAAMVGMYCRAHHGTERGQLCQECGELHEYARRRLERCIFGEDKPTCANCTVHCYKAVMRDRVREVMRWAGPRVLWRHPILTVRHYIAGRRPAPQLHRPQSRT